MNLSLLCSTVVEALAQATGVACGSQVFAPFWYTVTWQDLAHLPWGPLTERLRALATLPAWQPVVEHVRLFADRAVLHHRLYLAKSGTTLKLLRKCYLPAGLPLELIDIAVEFDQHLREMDEALRTGRAWLDHFGRQALLGEPVPALRAILEQARVYAAAYSSAQDAAYQIAEGVAEYLAWRETHRGDDPSMRPVPSGGKRSTTRHHSETLAHASRAAGELSERLGAARARQAHSTKRGGFTIMPGAPGSPLLAFCATCPPPQEVADALAGLGFQLIFTMEEQRFPAYSQTPPIPAQFHFRDEHSTEVLYLAGKDAGEEGERLESHASRFWVYPGADAPATQLVARFCATRWHLSWRRDQEAVA